MSYTAIVDYGVGNLFSISSSLKYLDIDSVVTKDADVLKNASHIILPGVGAFGDAMEKLNNSGLSEVIREAVRRKIPLLGICLGLQLLFEASEESPGVDGLSVLKGKIKRIPDKEGYKVPHIGWNSLKINPESKLFAGIPEDSYVYFVHSYYLEAEEPIPPIPKEEIKFSSLTFLESSIDFSSFSTDFLPNPSR